MLPGTSVAIEAAALVDAVDPEARRGGSMCQRNRRPTRASTSGLRSGLPAPLSASAALMASACGQLRDCVSSGMPSRDTAP